MKMTRLAQAIIVTAILALVASGCSRQAQTPDASAANSPAVGRIIPLYEPAGEDPALIIEERLLRNRRVLEEFSKKVNGFVRLPRSVKVIAKRCGEANAFFDPDQPAIELCYELSQQERANFTKVENEPQAVDDRVHESSIATLYHELGHALIEELQLPITGREEDVADQLAAFILTEDNASKEFLLTAAQSYEMSAVHTQDLDDRDLADSHSLDKQRSINMLCYLYGSDQATFQYLVDEKVLDSDRAPECEREYDQIVTAWDSLLKPHLVR